MSDQLIDLYAKPAISMIVYQSPNQNLIDQLSASILSSEQSSFDFQNKEVHKKLTKHLLRTHKKMLLQTETFLLALQLAESFEFKALIQRELNVLFINNDDQKNCLDDFIQLNGPSKKENGSQSFSKVIQTYAIALLYLCHKVTQSSCDRHASNVWVSNLRLQDITAQQIKSSQSQIAEALSFNILRPTISTLIRVLIEEKQIAKSQFPFFVHYLLQIYINSNLSKFAGQNNRIKRITLALSSIKLGCHFLCPKLWNEEILKNFNFGLEGVEKYSRILFGLFLDKENNREVHEKYKLKTFRGVSKIKIVTSEKPSTCLIKKNSSQKPQEKRISSDQEDKENNYRDF